MLDKSKIFFRVKVNFSTVDFYLRNAFFKLGNSDFFFDRNTIEKIVKGCRVEFLKDGGEVVVFTLRYIKVKIQSTIKYLFTTGKFGHNEVFVKSIQKAFIGIAGVKKRDADIFNFYLKLLFNGVF